MPHNRLFPTWGKHLLLSIAEAIKKKKDNKENVSFNDELNQIQTANFTKISAAELEIHIFQLLV